MSELVLKYVSQLDKFLEKSPQIVQLEKQTKIPKAYAATGVFAFVGFLIFFNIWGSLLTNLLGFLYPAYASFKAIESPEKKDDVQWLTYWTIFGVLNVVEYFSDLVLYWVPLYYTFKAVVILYLYLPQFNGAEKIYSQVLRPYLIPQEKAIDETIEKVRKNVGKISESIEKKSD